MKKWKLDSWNHYPVKHIPVYEDRKKLDMVLNKIKNFPPLVFAGETKSLKEQLANVVDGKAFCYKVGTVQKALRNFIQIILEILLK